MNGETECWALKSERQTVLATSGTHLWCCPYDSLNHSVQFRPEVPVIVSHKMTLDWLHSLFSSTQMFRNGVSQQMHTVSPSMWGSLLKSKNKSILVLYCTLRLQYYRLHAGLIIRSTGHLSTKWPLKFASSWQSWETTLTSSSDLLSLSHAKQNNAWLRPLQHVHMQSKK